MDGKIEVGSHVIRAQQFSREWIEQVLFPLTKEMKMVFLRGGNDMLRRKRMVAIFYQPSTRTRGSFQMAMSYLGGEVAFATENAKEFSSSAKGESLEHTIKVWCRYRPDVIILRHYEEGAAERAAAVSNVAIINAGDGPGQHPTQALLDIFTIQEKLGKIDGISIALVGDLKNGRTARSLVYLLSKFNGVKIFLISSIESKMKDDIKVHLAEKGVFYQEGRDIREVANAVDVIYAIRAQKEYRGSGSVISNNGDFLRIDRTVVDLLPSQAIIMHPLPIDSAEQEIRPEIENDPHVVCFNEQIDSGIFTRMALLKILIAPQS